MFKCLCSKASTDAMLGHDAVEAMLHGINIARTGLHDVEVRVNRETAESDTEILAPNEFAGPAMRGGSEGWLSATGTKLAPTRRHDKRTDHDRSGFERAATHASQNGKGKGKR